MKVPKSLGLWSKFYFVIVITVLVSLAVQITSASESIIIAQPVPRSAGRVSAGDVAAGELSRRPKVTPPKPNPRPKCDVSQARYDVNCYAKLRNDSLGCEADLGGVGSLETLCRLRSSITLGASSILVGAGTLEIEHHVSLSCPTPGCEIIILLSGNLTLGRDSSIKGGTLTIQAAGIAIDEKSSINATALAGSPPPGTSGTPSNFEGAGGGHGGRGASCERNEGKDQADVWGGDMYEWETLATPWNHGSRGGTTEEEKVELGGAGGGRIAITTGVLRINGTIEADGGSVDARGGGGSGGTIVIKALNM